MVSPGVFNSMVELLARSTNSDKSSEWSLQ